MYIYVLMSKYIYDCTYYYIHMYKRPTAAAAAAATTTSSLSRAPSVSCYIYV